MIFRLSQKLNTKIKAGTLGAQSLDENPFADWSAHLFSADRTQYIIICNTRSLYSAVMYAKGITNKNLFITRVLGGLRVQSAGTKAAFHGDPRPPLEYIFTQIEGECLWLSSCNGIYSGQICCDADTAQFTLEIFEGCSVNSLSVRPACSTANP